MHSSEAKVTLLHDYSTVFDIGLFLFKRTFLGHFLIHPPDPAWGRPGGPGSTPHGPWTCWASWGKMLHKFRWSGAVHHTHTSIFSSRGLPRSPQRPSSRLERNPKICSESAIFSKNTFFAQIWTRRHAPAQAVEWVSRR